jgi:hypothetical protein
MERAEAEAILDGDREAAIALLLRVGELVEANQRLEARVAELERRLNRSSRNSSLPPSQDPPSAPPPSRQPGLGRARGGQPGHEGRHRRLLAPERVDEVVEHWPRRCHTCAHVFDARVLVDAVEPWRHQVAELPLIAVRVTEHPDQSERTIERLLSASITCRLQKRSLFAYLTASIRGDPTPALA